MSWRDGVHIAGTSIWCDARRRRGVWFVSSLERIDRSQQRAVSRGVGQLIATEPTLAMLERTGRGDLSVPYRQRFTLGSVKLELLPSGRGIGAAALFAEVSGRKVLYASSIRTRSGGIGEPGETRACDALVIGAPYGAPRHEFPAIDQVADQLVGWVRNQLAANRTPVVFVDSVLDAIEVAARVGPGVPVSPVFPQAQTRSVATIAQRTRGVTKSRRLTPPPSRERHPKIYIVVDGDRGSVLEGVPGQPATALVSARALDGSDGCDAGFVWAGTAGHKDLLAWIEGTRAQQVYVTGACAGAIANKLGARARILGPPHQMPLFSTEPTA